MWMCASRPSTHCPWWFSESPQHDSPWVVVTACLLFVTSVWSSIHCSMHSKPRWEGQPPPVMQTIQGIHVLSTLFESYMNTESPNEKPHWICFLILVQGAVWYTRRVYLCGATSSYHIKSEEGIFYPPLLLLPAGSEIAAHFSVHFHYCVFQTQ